MYEIILDDAAREGVPEAIELPTLQRLLSSLLSARMTLSVTALADLLDLEPYEVSASLSRLHAVIHVPDDDNMPGLRTVHASFGDYLYSRAPDRIRIRQSLGHDVLAHGCLDVMAKQLHFNISQRHSSYEPNRPVQPDPISLSLQYACMQWVYHVSALPDGDNISVKIGAIFRPRLLSWLEVMSILRQVLRATRMLFTAAGTLGTHTDSKLIRFLRDAHSFAASSYEAIERSAPHIYLSALAFADKNSLVYQDFAPRCTGLITVDAFGISQHGGRSVMILTGHDSAVCSVSYSSDGRLLASGSMDGTVRLWDTRTGDEARPPLRIGEGSVLTVSFAQSSRWVASGTESGVVCVWNVTPGQASHQRLMGHSGPVNSVRFSPDGVRLASASDDATTRLWNIETGEQIVVLSGRARKVNGVAFSPDGEVLATACDDQTVRLWHSTAGRDTREPLTMAEYGSFNCSLDGEMISEASTNVDFSPDGSVLAGTAASGVTLWTCKTGEQIALLKQDNTSYCVQFSLDGRSLLATGDRAIRLWTLQPDPQHASWVDICGHGGRVNWATFSPDGLYIASASDDGTVRIWNAGSGQSVVQPLETHEDAVRTVAVSHDCTFIVSGSEDTSVRVWDAYTGVATIPPLRGHKGLVLSVSISPDGRLIASASTDQTIKLWDTQSGASVGEPLCDHTKPVRAVMFSHDGRWFASASEDCTARLWDTATRQALAVGPFSCQSEANTITFSPDDGIVAVGDDGGRIYLWRVDTGEQAREPLHANDWGVRSIRFSPDGTRIVSCGGDETARIWDLNGGQCLLALHGHTSKVASVAWSLDASVIVTGSDDATLRLWDAATGEPLATHQCRQLCGVHTRWAVYRIGI